MWVRDAMKLPVLLLLLSAPITPGGDLKEWAINLAKYQEGEPPGEIFVTEGSVRIKNREGGKVIEIGGDKPELDAGAVIGPSAKGAAMIEARILATSARRSFPRFGVGVHGQTGFRLFVVPARKELHLVKDDKVVGTAPFDWKSGAKVMVRLAVDPAGGGKWTVTGKAWIAGTPEPADAQITHEAASLPARGQCSIRGTPYAGTPIDFDAIKVRVGG